MTTPYTIERIWPGETVAIFASGPSMTAELAQTVRQYHSIAVRTAFRRVPWADMLIGIDGPPNEGFWDESKDFAGLRLIGSECDVDALFVKIPHEVVTIGPMNTLHIRNNALAAMRIAVAAGAAKLLLLGFDTDLYESIHGVYLTAGLAALTTELQAQGVVVEHYTQAPETQQTTPAQRVRSGTKAA